MFKTLRKLVLGILLISSPNVYAQEDLNRSYSEGMRAYLANNYTAAIENLTKIFEKTKNAEVLYVLAFSHYNLKQYEDAAKIFNLHATSFPKDPNALEVQLFLGRSLLNVDGKEDAALKALGKAAQNSEYLEEARFYAADAYINKKDYVKAADILEKAIAQNVSGPGMMRACLKLVDIYIEEDKLAEAVALLRRVQATSGYTDVIVVVNHRLVQIGDKYLDPNKEYRLALAAYSMVKPHAQVVALQSQRLEQLMAMQGIMKRGIDALVKEKKLVPPKMQERFALNVGTVEFVKNSMQEIKEITDYDVMLRYRITRCFFNMERYWYAIAGFESIVRDYPNFADASSCLYGAIYCQTKLDLYDSTVANCTLYLQKFPKGEQVSQVAEIKAGILFKQEKMKETSDFLVEFLKNDPSIEGKEPLRSILANTRFADGKFDDAAMDYDALMKNYPESQFKEEYFYRRALCDFLRNQYENTLASFQAYEQKYSPGAYTSDIRYRRGIILLAQATQATDPKKQDDYYNQIFESMDLLLKQPDAEQFRGQVYILLADAQKAKGGMEVEAATNYAKALKYANGDKTVIQYSLEEATTALKEGRRWAELTVLWKDFLKDNPGHDMELRGVSELTKLLVRDQKVDEAKRMLVQYIMKDIHNPRSEYCEMLLSQYASLFIPKKTFAKKGEQPAVIDPLNLAEELLSGLQLPEENRTVTYLARMQFAKGQFLSYMRRPELYTATLDTIATIAKPEDLSPIILTLVGQRLIEAKKYEVAKAYFTHLRDSFADSFYSEAGPIGIGEVELALADYPAALAAFEQALAKPQGEMLKEATFGKARALYGLKNYDEAKKLFEQIIGTKEWRGLEKAGALYFMGEITYKAKVVTDVEITAAHGFYQRVYSSHLAYPEYAIKSYLRAADMMRALGDLDGATRTLRELARHPKFKNLPEVIKATKSVE
jgi:tetratricopeptide (TPR) repeat protein